MKLLVGKLIHPPRILVAISGLALLVGAIWFVFNFHLTSWDFRNNLWAPAYLLLHGQNPFDIQAFCQGCNALWLPTTIGLFFPLGWLGQYPAASLWLLGNILMLAVIVWLSLGKKPPSVGLLAGSLILSFLTPITITQLYFGQITLFFVWVVLLIARFTAAGKRPLLRGHYLAAGCLMALAMAKPQLAILVLPGLLFAFYRSGGLEGSTTFVAGWLSTLAVLTLPLWVGYPQWPAAYLVALGDNPEWIQPSLYWILGNELGQTGLWLWAILALGVFVLNAHLWLTRPIEAALPWSLALTTLISPYVWSYDFVLLIPLLVWTLSQARSNSRRWLLSFGWVMCGVIMLWIRFGSDNSDHRYFWVPWFIMALTAGAHHLR